MADAIPMQGAVGSIAGASATGVAMRRSTRVSVTLAVRLRSLEDKADFEEECQTLVVNAHGCGLRSPRPLPVGARVEIEVPSTRRRGTGQVLNCGPLSRTSWAVGMQLDVVGNLWGLHPVPPDWPTETPSKVEPIRGPTANTEGSHGALSFSPFASSSNPHYLSRNMP